LEKSKGLARERIELFLCALLISGLLTLLSASAGWLAGWPVAYLFLKANEALRHFTTFRVPNWKETELIADPV
jgi:Na+(H+)/acetate symporter ActP